MISTWMSGNKTKSFSIKKNISSLSQEILTKEKIVQRIIDQKQVLRQSYIDGMVELRKGKINELIGIDNNQNNFTSSMDYLDSEEDILSHEIAILSDRRAQLIKNLIDQSATSFIPKKTILTLIAIVLFSLSSVLLLSHKHLLFNQPLPEKAVQD